MFHKNKKHPMIFINYIINYFNPEDILIQFYYILWRNARVHSLKNEILIIYKL